MWQRWSLLILITSALLIASLSFDTWAAPVGAPLRQSVPTRTVDPDGEPKEPAELQGPPTPTPIPFATPEPTVIPVSVSDRGPSVLLLAALGVVTVSGLAVLFIVRRRDNP